MIFRKSFVFLLVVCPLAMRAQTQSYTPPGQLPAPPQAKKMLTRILFIFDESQSMLGVWNNETKINVARKILIQLVDSLEKVPNVEMALRLYGHQSPVPPQDCNDTKLEVPFSSTSAGAIRQKLRWVEPKGTTPIAKSLEACAGDFPQEDNVRNIILLITDGIEACDGDPCAVSAMLQKKGIMLKPFVIGIGLETDFAKAFNCVGRVFNAKEEKQLQVVLKQAINQALNSTSVQVNLLDSNGKPTETDVTMTFFDQLSGLMKYNFVHTINSRGVPDTIVLDPLLTYRMVVQTIPPVEKSDMELVTGKHNVFSASVPQGYILVKKPGGNNAADLLCIVRKAGQSQTLNVQKAERPDKYICGKYDVEILTLPRIVMKNVEVNQSQTTTLQVAQPGMVVVMKNAPAYGGIYVQNKNSWDLVVNLDINNSGSESYNLQPGNYMITYRPKNAKDIRYSVDKKFTIKSGAAEHIKFY